jgi:hypothetical protein
MIIPDHTRRWVQGTAYIDAGNEYSKDGTCIGIGTIECFKYGRACGVAFASPVTITKPCTIVDDLFAELYGE